MIPQNEQGTIVLFSKLAEELGYTFKEIGTRCPDAILEKDGVAIRVEFEHRARTFAIHKHNPADVDLIICWEDDWPGSPVPVLSLERYVTLAHRTEEARLSFWQRLSSWYGRWLAFMAESKNTCRICGTPMNVRCDNVQWDEDNTPYQWANRHCPKCNHQRLECLSL